MSDGIVRDNDDSIFNEVLTRSATDRAFRDRLVADPESALEEVIGVPVATLPRPINVKFIEKDPGVDSVVVLPDFVAEGTLSDAELEAVAGGCTISCICTSSCCLSSIGKSYDEIGME